MTTAVELARWVLTHLWWVPLIIASEYLIAIASDRFSQRIRTRSDRRLHNKVSLAASRLPSGVRAAYEQEWHAELHHILHGQHARPVVRLWHGRRYTLGLHRAARSIARGPEGPRTMPQRLGTAVRSTGTAAVVVVVAAFMVAFAAVVAAAMLAVAVWAALVAVARKVGTGASLAAAYRGAFVAGCRALGLSWFGRPIPDPPGEQTLFAIGKEWEQPPKQ